VINAGIALLQEEKSTEAAYARALDAQLPLRQVLQTFAQVVSLWRTCVAHAAAMEFGAAAEMIGHVEEMSEAFFGLCEEVGGGSGWVASSGVGWYGVLFFVGWGGF